MRLALASVVSALAALVTAHTPPDYSKGPEGNAIIKPGLDAQVPVGEPYTIKWTPTTKGPISLVLLRGPSSNVKPIRTIAETIPNDGSFVWTPATDLEDDVTHYGLLLVVEGTGQYQWSSQFGIQNPGGNGGDNTHTSQQSSTSTGTATGPSNTTSTAPVTSKTKSACRMTTSTSTASATTTTATNSGSDSVPSSGAGQPTTTTTTMPTEAAPSGPGASGAPSESEKPAEPSTPASSSGPSVPVFTGAANRNALSMGAVAAGAFAVLAF